MNRYLVGTLAIGADTISTVGKVYTDRDTVTAVQQALKDKGYGSYLGSSGPNSDGVDGVMGPSTARAIRAMQSALGTTQTGVIDAGVLSALQVSAPLSGGQRSVSAQRALDAATAAEHAQTPADLTSAADQAQLAAETASPPAPPAVVEKVKSAKAAAAKARTPAEIESAKVQVKEATQAVQAAVGGFWGQSLIGPVKRWQAAVGVGAGVLVVLGLRLMTRRRR